MPQLSLDLLGSFHARLDDRPLTAFRSVKVQGLLAYLVLNSQQPHSRDVLAALFWPDEPDSVAKRNLRQSLYQLRRVLDDTHSEEGAFLLVTRSTAQFNHASDYTLDVAAFLASLEDGDAERAVKLYRGDLLRGFACDSAAFEHWLSQEREHLHQIALETLAGLADRSLAQGAYHDAQDYARQQLELEPWRELAHRQMMQSLALLGERSAALAQYETCRAVLEAEFGAEPAAETQALAERIREQELGKSAGPAGPARRLLAVPFVGRANEHAALVEAFQRTCDRSALVITLIGEAGIGKTRLAEHFLGWATTQGADVVSGYAFESSGRLSYQPLINALRQRLERENAPEDLLSDLWLAQLARILPELRDRYPDLPVPTQEENTARQHLFEAVVRLGLALAARAPVILFIDDWHWADGGSMDALHYAARRWSEERARILTILPLREKELTQSHDLQNWLTHLAHDVPCDEVRLGMLSRAETGQLINGLIGASLEDEMARLPEFCDWLYNETDGQSLFVVETLKALVEDCVFRPAPDADQWRIDWSQFDEQLLHSRVPPGIQDIIRGWLDRVSQPARDILSALAVLGENATFDNLRNVVDMDETQAIDALDQLLIRQLLQESEQDSRSSVDDPVYRFAHHKLRETIYTWAGAARRRILHRRAFDTLQKASAPPAELAYHALHAHMIVEAVRYGIAAGNEAMRLLAARDAVTHFEAVIQLTQESGWPATLSGADRQDLYLGLGRAYELIEMWPQAASIYQQMIDYARSIDGGTVECLGLNHLATVCINGLKDSQRAVMLLEQAGSIAEQNGDRRGLAETEWNLSTAARMAQDTYAAQDHGERALAIARELHHPQLLARCLNGLAYVNARLRRWDQVEAYAREARDIYATAGNRVLEMDNYRLIAWSQAFLGYPEASLDTLREALVFSQQIENVWGMAECGWRMAQNLLDLGRYGEAVRLAPQAVERARLVGQPTMFVMALATWGAVQRTVKAWGAARDTLLEALAEYSDKALTGYQDWILSELCALSAQTGDWWQAHVYARQNAQLMWDDSLLPITMAAWYETEALVWGGDGDLARAEVERLRVLAGDNKRFRLVASRRMAVLATWDRDFDAAIRHMHVARTLAQEVGYLGQEQSILAALGALYDELGDDSAAAEARDKASAITRRLGASIDDPGIRAVFLEGDT